MIVRIAKNGHSFKGAGLYYLHDKAEGRDTAKELKPTTDDRVAFIAGRNLVFDDPETAIAEMYRTAWAQNELKRVNGISLAGRKCSEPVKTLSLSWHPDEKPTPDHMIDAADKYLKHMGWSEHQALIIGHDDTAHPHVHIILNRVHPETGRVLDDHKDKWRSQEWALEYEKEMGRIWCEARVENHKPREERAPDRSANDNIPRHVVETLRPAEHEFKAHADFQAQIFLREKDLLKKKQREERENWFDQGKQLFKATRNTIYNEVKEHYRDQWAAHFAEQAERQKEAERHYAAQMTSAFQLADAGAWDEARANFQIRNTALDAVAKEFAERAADLRAQQLADTRAIQGLVLDQLRTQREESYKELLAQQQEARQEQREAHHAGERAAHLLGQTHAVHSANENVNPRPEPPPHHANTNVPLLQENIAALGSGQAPPEPRPLSPEAVFVAAVDKQLTHALSEQTTQLELPGIVPATPEDRAAEVAVDRSVTGAADLGAGAIGGAANYLADQLSEFFAPTPPEVRETQAKASEKARADAEASKPHIPSSSTPAWPRTKPARTARRRSATITGTTESDDWNGDGHRARARARFP